MRGQPSHLCVLPEDLLWCHIDATCSCHQNADSLVDSSNAVEDVFSVIVVRQRNPQDVDRVHQSVHDAVAATQSSGVCQSVDCTRPCCHRASVTFLHFSRA